MPRTDSEVEELNRIYSPMWHISRWPNGLLCAAREPGRRYHVLRDHVIGPILAGIRSPRMGRKPATWTAIDRGYENCQGPMVKITSVASDGLKAKSVVAMVQALIAGERDPAKIADLAKGPLRGKRAQLAEALDGMFDSHHGVIARALLDQIAFLDQRIPQMENGAIDALAAIPQSWGADATGETGRSAGRRRTRRCWPLPGGSPRSPASASCSRPRSSPRSAWT
jgi:hypothetical protein